jgi:hypothetical protein
MRITREAVQQATERAQVAKLSALTAQRQNRRAAIKRLNRWKAAP